MESWPAKSRTATTIFCSAMKRVNRSGNGHQRGEFSRQKAFPPLEAGSLRRPVSLLLASQVAGRTKDDTMQISKRINLIGLGALSFLLLVILAGVYSVAQ